MNTLGLNRPVYSFDLGYFAYVSEFSQGCNFEATEARVVFEEFNEPFGPRYEQSVKLFRDYTNMRIFKKEVFKVYFMDAKFSVAEPRIFRVEYSQLLNVLDDPRVEIFEDECKT